jgi:hypothetical protein
MPPKPPHDAAAPLSARIRCGVHSCPSRRGLGSDGLGRCRPSRGWGGEVPYAVCRLCVRPQRCPRMCVLHAWDGRSVLSAWRCRTPRAQPVGCWCWHRGHWPRCSSLCTRHALERRPGARSSEWNWWRLSATAAQGRLEGAGTMPSLAPLKRPPLSCPATHPGPRSWTRRDVRRQIGFNPRPCPQKRAPPSAPARVSFLSCTGPPCCKPASLKGRHNPLRALHPLSSDRRRDRRAPADRLTRNYGDACGQPRRRLNLFPTLALAPAPAPLAVPRDCPTLSLQHHGAP